MIEIKIKHILSKIRISTASLTIGLVFQNRGDQKQEFKWAQRVKRVKMQGKNTREMQNIEEISQSCNQSLSAFLKRKKKKDREWAESLPEIMTGNFQY